MPESTLTDDDDDDHHHHHDCDDDDDDCAGDDLFMKIDCDRINNQRKTLHEKRTNYKLVPHFQADDYNLSPL